MIVEGSLIVNGDVLFKKGVSTLAGLTVAGGVLDAKGGVTVTGGPLVATAVTSQLGATTVTRATAGTALTITARADASSLALSTTSPVSFGRMAQVNATVGVSSRARWAGDACMRLLWQGGRIGCSRAVLCVPQQRQLSACALLLTTCCRCASFAWFCRYAHTLY